MVSPASAAATPPDRHGYAQNDYGHSRHRKSDDHDLVMPMVLIQGLHLGHHGHGRAYPVGIAALGDRLQSSLRELIHAGLVLEPILRVAGDRHDQFAVLRGHGQHDRVVCRLHRFEYSRCPSLWFNAFIEMRQVKQPDRYTSLFCGLLDRILYGSHVRTQQILRIGDRVCHGSGSGSRLIGKSHDRPKNADRQDHQEQESQNPPHGRKEGSTRLVVEGNWFDHICARTRQLRKHCHSVHSSG